MWAYIKQLKYERNKARGAPGSFFSLLSADHSLCKGNKNHGFYLCKMYHFKNIKDFRKLIHRGYPLKLHRQEKRRDVWSKAFPYFFLFEGNKAKQKEITKFISETEIKAINCNKLRRQQTWLTQVISDDKEIIIKKVPLWNEVWNKIFLPATVYDVVYIAPDYLSVFLKIRKAWMSASLCYSLSFVMRKNRSLFNLITSR